MYQITTKAWLNYVQKMSDINAEAGRLMREYVQKNGFADRQALIDYAYAVATKYGEGSAELACEMYDAIAEMAEKFIESAEPAATATYSETAKAVNGSLLQSPSGQLIDAVVQRLVKQAAADTTLNNAIRDGAYAAWVPSGDTCAFCITLSSRGWQRVSKRTLKKGHAEHIHSNCDCQYSVSFDGGESGVEGYDPEVYREMYDSYDGKSTDRINAMRREQYKIDADKIRAQKRAAYAKRVEASKEL